MYSQLHKLVSMHHHEFHFVRSFMGYVCGIECKYYTELQLHHLKLHGNVGLLQI